MKLVLLYSPALALFLAASAPAQTVTTPSGATIAVPEGTMIQGRIVRTGPDQFVVQAADDRQFTFYTTPQTAYYSNNATVPYSALAVGTNVYTWYTAEGNRYLVRRVNVQPAAVAVPAPAPEVITVAPVRVTEPAPVVGTPIRQVLPLERTATSGTNFYALPDSAVPATASVYEGEVIRVGPDQVVLRTAAAPEVVVYVNPQTTYRVEQRAATITDLRPGTPIRVEYSVQDRRPVARGIVTVQPVRVP